MQRVNLQRLPRIVVLCFLLALTVTGPAGGTDLGTSAQPQTGTTCPAPILVAERAAKDAVPDSVWYRFGPSVAGALVKAQTSRWVVDYTWFRLSTDLGRAFTFDEMESLQTSGVLDTSTTVGTVTWRIVVKASTAAEAQAQARRRHPSSVPEAVVHALRKK